MVQIPVKGSVERRWPRLAAGAGAGAGAAGGGAGLAAVGASVSYKVSVRNPSRSHALLLQPVISPDRYPL